MENEVKRIIVSLNKKNTIEGIVVVTQDGIETYGYNEEKNVEEIYKELIESLNVNKKEFKDIEKQLFENRIIVGTHKNVTVKVIKDKSAQKYSIEYANGEVTIVSFEDYSNIDEYNISLMNVLTEMCDLYGINYKNNYGKVIDENSLKQLKKMGFYSEQSIKEQELEDVSFPEEAEEVVEEEIDDNGKKLKVNWKRVIALVTVGAIFGVGFSLGRSSLGKKAKKTNTVIETNAPVDQNNVYYNPTLEPVITYTPAPTATQYLEKIYFENQDNLFKNYVKPESGRVVIKELNKNKSDSIYQRGDGGYDFRYAYLFQKRNENMEDIANAIQKINELDERVKIGDTQTLIYFENLEQYKDIREKAFIKYFSMIGNEILTSAYNNNISGIYGANEYSKLSCSETLRLIWNDDVLSVYINGNHNYIRYSELSNETKEIILNLAWTNSLVLNSNPEEYILRRDRLEDTNLPEVHYNGTWYTKQDIQNIITLKYNELEETKIK